MYKNFYAFFGPGPMGGVYLDFRLPCPAKIAVGLLTLRKWRPFENYLPPHKMPSSLIMITHISAFPASNRMISSQKHDRPNFL
jgi:hypothetical protein